MPALCSMPDIAYYAQNYARPIAAALVFSFSLYVQVLAAVCVRVCVTFSCADESLWEIGCGD